MVQFLSTDVAKRWVTLADGRRVNIGEDRPEGAGGTPTNVGRMDHVPGAIARAVAEQPDRAGHGSRRGGTGKTGFWVKPDGSVVQYDKLPVSEVAGAISVHSHSSAEATGEEREDFQPANAGDVYADIVNSRRAGAPVVGSVVIMADGRMEALLRTEKTDPKFYTLSMRKLDAELTPDYKERERYYDAHKDDPGYSQYDLDRERLRVFAQRYGLVYHEGMRWRSARGEKQTAYEMLWSGLRHPRFVEIPAQWKTPQEIEDHVRRDVARLLAKDHTHPPAGSHAGPAPRNEYGETIEGLVTIEECARLVGVSATDIERLVASAKIRTYGVAKLIRPEDVTRALSELRAPGHRSAQTPLVRPRPDGPQSEVPSALGAREMERSG